MGEGNIAGGSWWSEEDGIRITVLHTVNNTKVSCFDWSNYNEDSVQCSFVKYSKLDYRHGHNLTPTETYVSHVPDAPLPTIVGHSGNSIAAIKRYFTGVEVLTDIAAQAGLVYEDLISGDYKLLLEPMAYFYYNGVKYAMTATEAAYFDVLKEGDMRYWMGRLTHQNLPLAMFLERPDEALGLYVWNGATTGKQANLDIINYLGMGIVSFDEPSEVVPEAEFDYVFRCDTDVIVSFPIENSRDTHITPDDNRSVSIQVGDSSWTQDFICPAYGTQLVWVRWHTPSTPQTVTASATGGPQSIFYQIKIEALEEQTPPDPTYYDRGDGFTLEDTPDYGSNLSTTWGEWDAEWIQYSGMHGVPPYAWYCVGYCPEHGYWDFDYTEYSASLTVSCELKPDDRCQTDYESYPYGTVMPSGYGVQAQVSTSILRTGAPIEDVISVQNVVATFPEFDYQTYDRLLERGQGAIWRFKENPYSLYRSRIHYTPLWYPDDTYYPVTFCAFDAWTPGGQLYATVSDKVYIYQSCLDDWYIHIVE